MSHSNEKNDEVDKRLRRRTHVLTEEASSHRYSQLKELGSGSSSIVYQAWDNKMQRRVALKMLRKEHLHSASRLYRFEREWRLLVRLDHPSFPSVFDQGVLATGQPFFTQQDFSSRTFSDLLRDRIGKDFNQQTHQEEPVRILHHICSVLDIAHRNGVIHQDVKSENIFLGPENFPVLGDWGCARLEKGTPMALEMGEDCSSRVAGIFGTPTSMAPEQARDEVRQTNQERDIFSVGAILFEILTGRMWMDACDLDQALIMAARGPHLSTLDFTWRPQGSGDPFATHESPREGISTNLLYRKLIPGRPQSASDPLIARTPVREDETVDALQEALIQICADALHPNPECRIPTAGELGRRLKHWHDDSFLLSQAVKPALELKHRDHELIQRAKVVVLE